MGSQRVAILLLALSTGLGDGVLAQTDPPLKDSNPMPWSRGSEADAREVVKLILGSLFEQRPNGRYFVLATQIREAWLPALKTIDTIRLTDSEVQRHLATCGDYWALADVTKRDNVVSMTAGP